MAHTMPNFTTWSRAFQPVGYDWCSGSWGFDGGIAGVAADCPILSERENHATE